MYLAQRLSVRHIRALNKYLCVGEKSVYETATLQNFRRPQKETF